MKQCLIIGYGSIGKRHAEILHQLGCSVSIVTSQKISTFTAYSTVTDALASMSFNYVVIANATSLHYETLLILIKANYTGIVLVEKPLFSHCEILPKHNISKIVIGYNLRFHELLINTKNLLKQEKLITFSTYVGQYLPTWRKNTDYRQSYSARKNEGGGVLRDLSHELDYTLWLCGSVTATTADGGQFSNLEIDSDDVYSILMKCKLCPIVTMQLNYLDRIARREITINTQKGTIYIDLVKEYMTVNGEFISPSANGMNQSYINQHKQLLDAQYDNFCSYDDGMQVMRLIEAIEDSTEKRIWVNL